ncbi:uncharacterized protein LOC113312218 [Papaver somniferum]|uniref:uncharacterized protein LOC113312218 n=1 Tax=Papaver somniferum TaxID=3469 RepID=UPI000E6F79EE|nr:uncharacterized protein LOC113312218 [Papaver somniferum]
MTIHGESMFIFDFQCAEDRVRALEMGFMFISNRLFIIKPWSRTVEQDIAELKSLPVWMNFRNDPLFMWNKKGLSMIANFLGKPLMMDTQTLNKTRMNYARICVEVDITCEFLDSFTFTLGGKDKVEIKMEYSWKPPKCTECALFGHRSLNCPKHVKSSPKVVQKWVQKKVTTNIDEEGWITKSKTGTQNSEKVTEVINKEVSQTTMDTDSVVPAQEFTTVLQEISARKDNNVNEFIASNPFFILDKCMENSHELPTEHNKENFQALIQAAQQKSKEIEASSSGSRAHFQRREGLPPPAINLFPKVADLKKYARVETHVQAHNKTRIRNNINPSWCYLDNDSVNSVGRIWIAWDPKDVQVSVLSSTSQAVFLDISFSSMINFVVTFIYGENYYVTRSSLWDAIISFASFNTKPWVLMGDFNSLLFPSEKVGGALVFPYHYQDFSNCVQQAKIMDLQYSGCFYTWTNYQQDGTIIRSKLDRAMVNMDWILQFQISKVEFLLPGISDQSPCIITVADRRKHGPPPFRLYNFLTEEKEFMEVVRRAWNIEVRGNPMIKFVTKMKRVKHDILEWKKLRFKNMSEQIMTGKRKRMYVAEYVKLAKYEEAAAKQQSRIKWLNLGDSNTSFFHNSLKERRSRNSIISLYDRDNVKLVEDQEIAKECISFHSELFGSDLPEDVSTQSVFNFNLNACIQQDDVADLIKPVTREEIVAALHSIGSSKAPGPDGFTNHFLKSCWPLVGDDFFAAIQNFFHKLKLLKEVNSTFITLIAKKKNPSTVLDYIPISCCNVIYALLRFCP